MLNDYQRRFLALLVEHEARFLVIGGQAREHYTDTHTRDLDILIDIEPPTNNVERALQEWKRRYPIHTMLDLEPPLALRPMVQMQFPDDVCAYQDDNGNVRKIEPKDGVDVLHPFPAFGSLTSMLVAMT